MGQNLLVASHRDYCNYTFQNKNFNKNLFRKILRIFNKNLMSTCYHADGSIKQLKHKMFDNCLTNPLKLKEAKQKLTADNMKTITTTVRNFLRNYKTFYTAKNMVIVENRGKPMWTLIPHIDFEKPKKNRGVKIDAKKLEKYMFEGGDPHLSQKIDEILYKNWKS